MANKNNPFSSYYNYPKVWGEAEPQERWHSDKSEKGIIPPWLKTGSDEFDNRVQEELTKAYKLYENGKMTNDEFKYIEASLEELIKNKEELISRNATFAVAPTTDEGIKKGDPKYKLMVMQDKLNPFTKDLPSGDTMSAEDFR